MSVELLDFGWEHAIECQDVISGSVDVQKFQLSGFRLFGNDVYEYFYKEKKLDLYLNLFRFIHLATDWYKNGLEYSLNDPLSLYPYGSYISKVDGNSIEFKPVRSLKRDQLTIKQKLLEDAEGRVFFEIVEEAALKLPLDKFVSQLRAAVPELTTLLYLLKTGDIKIFENSEETDVELLNLYRYMADAGVI